MTYCTCLILYENMMVKYISTFLLIFNLVIQYGFAQNQRIFFPGEDNLTLGSSCSITAGVNGKCTLIAECPHLADADIEFVFCSPFQSDITVCCPDLGVRIKQEPVGLEKITHPFLIWDLDDEIDAFCGTPYDKGGYSAFIGSKSFGPYHLNDLADDLRNQGFTVNVLKTFGDAILNMTYSNGTFTETIGADSFNQYLPAVGGKPAPEQMAFYMALIGQRRGDKIDWICDGVVLNREWVLTAAHCFIEHGIQPDVVRLGDYDWKIDGEGSGTKFIPFDAEIANVVVYPEFNINERYHDIALVKLSKPYPMLARNINPICLPWDNDTNLDIVGFNVTLSGWGATEFSGAASRKTNILQAVELNVFDTSVCQESYSKLLDFRFKWPQGMTPDKTLCVGWAEGGRDACKGDSGGPVAYRPFDSGPFTLAGIVSTGFGCGLAEYPGIYIPMNNPNYLRWIKKVAFEGFLDSADYPDYIERPWCWKNPLTRVELISKDDICAP